MIEALSDISRTNQLQITSSPEDVAEKLYQYLFKQGKGIECFIANDVDIDQYVDSELSFFQKRHRAIKHEIKKRLSEHSEEWKVSDIQYFMSYVDGKSYVFFLTPNKMYSGWKQLFCNDRRNQGKILNLIFKRHILSEQLLDSETLNGLEELLLVHSRNLSKSEDGLVVWGQNVSLNYNHHNVLTLTLTRKRLLFLPGNDYRTIDGEEMGEILIYKKKKYYCAKELDARGKNSIYFMRFDTQDDEFKKFKKTQLSHYQNLMTTLESFLKTCGITYTTLHFQADHYWENSFIKSIESVETLEIINNSGMDLTESDKHLLEHVLTSQGISNLTFYADGKTISTYERVESEEKPCWKINEVIQWANIALDTEKNYLVFNKILDEETESSMAYQHDGLWYPATKDTEKNPTVDFYSQLKKKLNYLETGTFFSIQGVNVTVCRVLTSKKANTLSVLKRPATHKEKQQTTQQKVGETSRKGEFVIDDDVLYQDTKEFTGGKLLKADDLIRAYLAGQLDETKRRKFYEKYRIACSPEFEKIFIELGIKNWIRAALLGLNVAFPVTPQPFSEKQFFAIYVRSPKDRPAKAVAVEFLYKDENLYIKNVLREMKEIRQRFPFLRTRRNKPEVLINDQQYFVDEENRIYISCYTSDMYTPTLIGRKTIIQDLENGTLEINRRKDSKLLPLVLYYNDDVQQVKNLVCLDLHNKEFIQYYVPPAKSLKAQLKKAEGFRVYHLIGKTYSKKVLTTDELINHPITSLHFNTLTQNILKISDNSQSSLLQKVAKVFIEN